MINNSWDSLWHVDFKIDDESDGSHLSSPTNAAFVVDQKGGVFYVWSYRNPSNIPVTRAHWITNLGLQWGTSGSRLAQKGCYGTFNGESKLGIYFSDGTAQLYDTSARAMWDSMFIVINNFADAYSPTVASDNNGGAIIAYWTTLGGIFAQHTGRAGKVGIVTKIPMNETMPLKFELSQNYPNPFNPSTRIQLSVPVRCRVRVTIFNILGQQVSELVNEEMSPGISKKTWNANVASGLYFYRLEAVSVADPKKRFVEVKKMVLVK